MNDTEKELFGTGEEVVDGGNAVTYASDADYMLMNEIPLTEKTMWTLPEGFTGTFAEAPKEDAPLYDKESDTVYVYNNYQLLLIASENSAEEPIMSYDMLPEKPEWLTQEDINQYAQQMIPEKEAEKTEPPSPAVSEQESETNRIADEARLSALEAQKTALDSMMKTLEVSRDVLNPQAITAIEQAIASITADIERLSEPDAEKTAHTEQETQKNAEKPAPEHSESVAIDCDIADITRADDGFYEFELSIETVVEALNRAADVSEDLQNFFVENGVPEKSVIEADEPYMVYGEMNPDIDDGISMRLQLINTDIDVEIPLYKEECHALSEKIAILDKAEPELPKEDNEKEFVQLEFDFDKE